MSSLDVEVLEALRLSGSKAAQLLGLSRQALFEGLKKDKDYLNADRIAALLARSAGSEAEEATAMAGIANVVPDRLSTIRSALQSLKTLEATDVVLLFRARIRESADLADVNNEVSSETKAAVYFVPELQSAGVLTATLKRARRKGRVSSNAALYVAETNLARVLPNISIARSAAGIWSGTYDLDETNAGSRVIPAEYLQRLLWVLRGAEFGLEPDDPPNEIVPDGRSVFDGFYFHKRFDSTAAPMSGATSEIASGLGTPRMPDDEIAPAPNQAPLSETTPASTAAVAPEAEPGPSLSSTGDGTLPANVTAAPAKGPTQK